MAQQKANGKFSGKIGRTYLRTLNGKQVMQSNPIRKKKKIKPDDVQIFQKVAEPGKIMRATIQAFLKQRHDAYMYQRFTSTLLKALQQNITIDKKERTLFNCNLSSASGFEFNINKGFKEVFLSPITMDSNKETFEIKVNAFIPKEQVAFPKDYKQASLHIYTWFLLPSGIALHPTQYEEIIEFNSDINQVEEHVWHNICPTKDVLTFTVVEIQFYKTDAKGAKLLFNTKAYNPSMLVAIK